MTLTAIEKTKRHRALKEVQGYFNEHLDVGMIFNFEPKPEGETAFAVDGPALGLIPKVQVAAGGDREQTNRGLRLLMKIAVSRGVEVEELAVNDDGDEYTRVTFKPPVASPV